MRSRFYVREKQRVACEEQSRTPGGDLQCVTPDGMLFGHPSFERAAMKQDDSCANLDARYKQDQQCESQHQEPWRDEIAAFGVACDGIRTGSR